ncbi:uncharacterized protein M6B38_358045 [Iris pallida]|uniref:3-oxoacyl-[acyl-carrier-protein] reductase n=1 Tax=Iris pallida TaxID=29817 RepID=A0AAX6GL14_IRIPA|nr:uncharacterized protein M6B38_358045 [Iris pallida]
MEGKVVMVTGASSGIGRELCLYLAASGCRIVAAARRIDRLKSLCEEINTSAAGGSTTTNSDAMGGVVFRAVAIELDVSNESSVIQESVRKAWDAFGRIDALVNNAGIRGGVYSPLEWSEDDWESNIKTNLTGLWLVSKHVCRLMRDAQVKASVVNISSIAGLQRGQLPGGLAYTASKAGVNAITKVMALELGISNIKVNSIAPGLFKSEITEGLMQREWLSNVARKTVPLRNIWSLQSSVDITCSLFN